MKFVTLLTLSLFFCGCATKHLASKVEQDKYDGFKEESFLRYTQDRLNGLDANKYAALSLCHQKDFEEGLTTLRGQLKEKKKSADYWNQVGMCYFLREDYPKAEFYFNFSLEQDRNKNYAAALNNLGILKLKDRHFDEAITYFNKAKRGGHKVPRFNLAQVFLEFNLVDKALIVLEDLHRSAQSDPDLLFSLASAYLMKGRTKNAMGILDKIPNEFREREDIALINAVTLYEQRNYYAAKEVLEATTFLSYYPLKKSAQKLTDLVEAEIARIEKENKERE
ncbi:MAG: CDC27 family protein [Bdellovibrionota bacterium]|nr:CDC27 family protein [Bdellovibrionota bacterium]